LLLSSQRGKTRRQITVQLHVQPTFSPSASAIRRERAADDLDGLGLNHREARAFSSAADLLHVKTPAQASQIIIRIARLDGGV
jgi:hypothetical protein